MITAQVESLTERLEEMKPLFPMHWEELALNKDRVPLDPMYEIYLERDANGQVLFVTLRELGKPVGYVLPKGWLRRRNRPEVRLCARGCVGGEIVRPSAIYGRRVLYLPPARLCHLCLPSLSFTRPVTFWG